MDPRDDHHRALSLAFSNVLRASNLAGRIDVTRTATVFRALLQKTPSGKPVPLEEMYELLVHKAQLPANDVAATLLAFEAKEKGRGTSFLLPSSLASLPEDERRVLALSFAKKATTVAGANPKDAELSAETLALVEKSVAAHQALAPGINKFLVGGLAIAIALFLGVYAWLNIGRPKPAHDVKMPKNADALYCVIAKGNGSVLMCEMTRAEFEKMTPDVLASKAAVTKATASTLGYGKVFVLTMEDHLVRSMF
jgi:hypothetical protein